jgi:hypothetical protein
MDMGIDESGKQEVTIAINNLSTFSARPCQRSVDYDMLGLLSSSPLKTWILVRAILLDVVEAEWNERMSNT